MKSTLRRQVFEAVGSIPVGVDFTSRDIFEAVTYKHANLASVASAIKEYPGIVNTTDRKTLAVWRRTE